MPSACECGQETRPGDVECSLCGRDLGTPVPEVPAAGRPVVLRAPVGARPRSVALLVGAAVIVVALGLLTYALLRPGPSAPPANATSSRQDPDIPTPAADGGSPTWSEPAEDPSPVDEEPSEDSSTVDPPLRPSEQAAPTEVVDDSPGTACDTNTSRTLYGGYPRARCDFWKPATGLRSGESAKKGSQHVACQRDLRQANPTYTKDQSNTWWVWSQSTSGTWDWFPETAVEQGTSDQPINGVARCLP